MYLFSSVEVCIWFLFYIWVNDMSGHFVRMLVDSLPTIFLGPKYIEENCKAQSDFEVLKVL